MYGRDTEGSAEAQMTNGWIPSSADSGYRPGLEQILYAVLGPRLSAELVDLVRQSGKPSDDLRNLARRLDDEVGGPPQQLFFMGMALGRLLDWLRAGHGTDSDLEEYEQVLRNVGWDALKMFGGEYSGMFRRFGFDEETLDHYMRTCVDQGLQFAWPPPGVAYEPLDKSDQRG